MISITYGRRGSTDTVTVAADSEKQAEQLMREVNRAKELRGVSVTGSKKYFLSTTGQFFIDHPGKVASAA